MFDSHSTDDEYAERIWDARNAEAEGQSAYADLDAPHHGHFSLWGSWHCDTCDSPYCELA